MEGHLFENMNQIHNWFSVVVGFIERKTRINLGFRRPVIGHGRIKSKEILRRQNNARQYCSGGSGNYQWDFEPTLTLEVKGLTCEVIVPKKFYDQLAIGDRLGVEYQVSRSGTRIKARIIL